MRPIARHVGTYTAEKMRAKHTPQSGYYTTIATKISRSDKQKLCNIAGGFGMSFYELLQALLLAIVRYFDQDSLISYESNTMLNAFATVMFSTAGSYSPLSIKGHERERIKNAILFVERPNNERPQMLAVSKNDDGDLMESYNFDTMLTDFMEAYDPELLKLLEDERKRLGYFSIGHALHELLLRRATPPADKMSDEINTMFQDVRIPSGQQINEDVRYKRKNNNYGQDYTTITKKQTFRADL